MCACIARSRRVAREAPAGARGAPGGRPGVLISGDMVLPHISTHVGSPAAWLPGNPVALFQESVRRLAGLPADTLVLPSHGEPFVGLRERVGELESHHEERCRTIAGVLGEPRSAAELLQVVFQRELDPLQLMLAMNEAVAHLEYMTDRGEARAARGARWHHALRAEGRLMTSGTSALFEPTTIRGMVLPNRFVRSATWGGWPPRRAAPPASWPACTSGSRGAG